jgi:hypothetical protein
MKKVLVFLLFGLLLVSTLSFALAEQERGQNNLSNEVEDDSEDLEDRENESSDSEEDETDDSPDSETEEEVEIEYEVEIENHSLSSDFNITKEEDKNETKYKFHFKNGKGAEIKIMPDTASETAIARLRLRVCNESNNCTIQLKEVGQGNETRAAYEIQVERHAKILGLFSAKAKNKVQIDAETGDVLFEGKPWWSFLAKETD